MEIRKGTLKDLEAIAAVEAACFPAAEAATAEEFAERLQQYGDHFWLLWEGERLLAFVDGFCTDWPDLTEDAKAAADRVIGDVREDGLAALIEELWFDGPKAEPSGRDLGSAWAQIESAGGQ